MRHVLAADEKPLHWVGSAKRDFLSKALDPAALSLMRRIKAQFDPDGILNPGKLLPDADGSDQAQ